MIRISQHSPLFVITLLLAVCMSSACIITGDVGDNDAGISEPASEPEVFDTDPPEPDSEPSVADGAEPEPVPELADIIGAWRRNAGNPNVDVQLEFASDGDCLDRVVDATTGEVQDGLDTPCTFTLDDGVLTVEDDSFLCDGIVGSYEVSGDGDLNLRLIEDECDGRALNWNGNFYDAL